MIVSDSLRFCVSGILLHQEHDGDRRHEAPVNTTEQTLVERSHLLIIKVSKGFESGLDGRRRDSLARIDRDVDLLGGHPLVFLGGHGDSGLSR